MAAARRPDADWELVLKRNPVERLKREKAPLGIRDELPALIAAGYENVAEEDIVRLDWLGDEVRHATVDALAQPAFGQELLCLLLVPARQLDVGRAVGAGSQQIELDCTDAAADLEHGLAGHISGELDEAPRGAAEPLLPVAVRVQLGLLRAEEALVTARLAATRHAADPSPAIVGRR